MIYTTSYPSPIGELYLAQENDSLTALWMENQRCPLMLAEKDVRQEETELLRFAADWLRLYFAGKRPSPSKLSIAPNGNAFRRTVWRRLLDIPYGEVVTYGEVARDTAAALGRERMSAQAVGGAIGHNPISIIIPCHRVIGSDGALTGYAGGIDRKLFLLTHEGAELSRRTRK